MLKLTADPLPWLLEPDELNPSIRYFALRDLLDLPDDAPNVRRARRDIMRSGPVPSILAGQEPDGHWAKAGTGYSPKYRGTQWQIIFLAELGADPSDTQVRQGCDYLLNHALASNAAFSCYQPPAPRGALHCLNGNLLCALQRLGFGDDPRVQAALAWEAGAIIGAQVQYYAGGTTGPGFACGMNLGQPCAWGAAKAMRGLMAMPVDKRTPEVRQAIQAGAEFLLTRDVVKADYPYSGRVSSAWFAFGFPLSYWSDILEVAWILAELGYGRDPRLQDALRLIMSKQDGQGRWRLRNSLNGKMWSDIERRGQPSKWVTLRALRALKAAGMPLAPHAAG